MAWEWVAPVITGVVGIAGTTGTVVVAIVGRRHAETVARNASQAASELARDGRRAETLLSVLEGMNVTIMAVAVDRRPEEARAALPSEAQRARMATNISVYGTPDMNYTFTRWQLACVRLSPSWKEWEERGEVEPTNRREDVDELVRLHAHFTILVREVLYGARPADVKDPRPWRTSNNPE